MKKLCLVLVVVLVLTVGGCGVVRTPQERWRLSRQVEEMNLRELVDDWDYFWLYERCSGMSYWTPMFGD